MEDVIIVQFYFKIIVSALLGNDTILFNFGRLKRCLFTEGQTLLYLAQIVVKVFIYLFIYTS